MPLLDIGVRTLSTAAIGGGSTDQGVKIATYLVSAILVVILITLMLYLERVFNIFVPTELVPWCQSSSQSAYLDVTYRVILVISNAVETRPSATIVEIIVLFLLLSASGCYRMMFVPSYHFQVDLLKKFQEFFIALLFLIGMFCKFLEDKKGIDLIFLLAMLPLSTLAWVSINRDRKLHILQQIKNSKLKLETEYEFGLYILTTLISGGEEQLLSESEHAQILSAGGENGVEQSFDTVLRSGLLNDLLQTHMRYCKDENCACYEYDDLEQLLQLQKQYNSEIVPLMQAQKKKFRKFIEENPHDECVSTISQVVRNTKSQSTNLEEHKDNDDFEEEFKDEGGIFGSTRRSAFEESTQRKFEFTSRNMNLTGVLGPELVSGAYKLNVPQSAHRFLAEIMHLFFYTILEKYPDNLQIFLLYCHFALHYRHKEMLCIYQMRSFNSYKLNSIRRLCHKVNEQFLLWEIRRLHNIRILGRERHQGVTEVDLQLNGDFFIRMDELQTEFNGSREALTLAVVNFWTLFRRAELNVNVAVDSITHIADQTKRLHDIFNELDSLRICKDYQMYFQFAIVLLYVLSDSAAYETYIAKMKNILDMDKVIRKNYVGARDTEAHNFLIVDATTSRFGQIILLNHSLRLVLGWTVEQAQRFSIEHLMPTPIQAKHSAFIRRFNHTGQSYLIDNRTTMFIKRGDGFVVPAEFFLKFHYSIRYQYTFLALVQPLQEFAPFRNQVKYPIDQLIFLIAENDAEGGSISEYSESFLRLLQENGLHPDLELDSISKRLQDLLQGFDYIRFQDTHEERSKAGTIYESIHRLDLSAFTDTHTQEEDEKTNEDKFTWIAGKMSKKKSSKLRFSQDIIHQANKKTGWNELRGSLGLGIKFPKVTPSFNNSLGNELVRKNSLTKQLQQSPQLQRPSFQHDPKQSPRGSQRALRNSLLPQVPKLTARTRIFEERFSGGLLELNIVCLALMSEQELHMSRSSFNALGGFNQSIGMGINYGGVRGGDQSYASSVFMPLESDTDTSLMGLGALQQRIQHQQTVKRMNQQATIGAQGFNATLKQQKDHEIVVQSKAESQSESSSISDKRSSISSSSSAPHSNISMNAFKTFDTFGEHQTPKTLALVLKLLLILYVIMVAVASVNLGLNIRKQHESDIDIHSVKLSYDRMQQLSFNQLLFRVQLNIANGYEANSSPLISDRFTRYRELQEEAIQRLKETQTGIQLVKFSKSEAFIEFETGLYAPLYFLDEFNKAYQQPENVHVAFNVYIAKITEINKSSREDLVGNLPVQTLKAKGTGKYKPSFFEKSVYFLSQNALRTLRRVTIDSSDFYARESETHSQDSISSTLITAILSIIVIVVIVMMIAPILTQAETRRFKALFYFLKLPKTALAELVHNCDYVLHMSDHKRLIEIYRDYETILGIRLIDAKFEQLWAKDRKRGKKSKNKKNRKDSTDNSSMEAISIDWQEVEDIQKEQNKRDLVMRRLSDPRKVGIEIEVEDEEEDQPGKAQLTDEEILEEEEYTNSEVDEVVKWRASQTKKDKELIGLERSDGNTSEEENMQERQDQTNKNSVKGEKSMNNKSDKNIGLVASPESIHEECLSSRNDDAGTERELMQKEIEFSKKKSKDSSVESNLPQVSLYRRNHALFREKQTYAIGSSSSEKVLHTDSSLKTSSAQGDKPTNMPQIIQCWKL